MDQEPLVAAAATPHQSHAVRCPIGRPVCARASDGQPKLLDGIKFHSLFRSDLLS